MLLLLMANSSWLMISCASNAEQHSIRCYLPGNTYLVSLLFIILVNIQNDIYKL